MSGVDQFAGVVGVINTPFSKDNAIDCDSLCRYVDYGIENGVSGFLVPAMAAEINKLTSAERELIVRTVVNQTNGRVPIIGGASAEHQATRMKYIRTLTDLGCDGVLVSIPFDDEARYKSRIREAAKLEPGFLMIQDWEFSGYGIPVKVIAELFEEIDIFNYLKVEVVPAGVKYSAVLEATKGQLHVSGGWASSQMIEGLDRGVSGFMATILPSIYSKIYKLHRTGQRSKAVELFNKLVPILAFSHQHVDISIHFNKRMVHKLGLYTTDRVRDPILPFDKYLQRVADELIEYAQDLLNNVREDN